MRTMIVISMAAVLAAVAGCQGKKNAPKTEAKAGVSEPAPAPDAKAERQGKPSAVAFYETRVLSDWNTWQQQFNGLEGERRAAGVVFHYLMRGAGDPKIAVLALMGYERGELEAALKHTALPDGRITHAELIDSKRPADPNKARIGMVVHAEVNDLKGFLDAFREDAARHEEAGIRGFGLFKYKDEPNTYILHLEAEKSEPLKNYVESNALAKVLAAGGLKGAPRTQLVGHIEARTYGEGPAASAAPPAAAAPTPPGAPTPPEPAPAGDAKTDDATPADAQAGDAKPADAKPADAKAG